MSVNVCGVHTWTGLCMWIYPLLQCHTSVRGIQSEHICIASNRGNDIPAIDTAPPAGLVLDCTTLVERTHSLSWHPCQDEQTY